MVTVTQASVAGFDGRHRRTIRTRERLIQAFIRAVHDRRRLPEARELAAAADCSVRTVFERFGSLEGLAAAAFDKVLERHRSAVPGLYLAQLDRPRRIRLHVAQRARVAERWHAAWRLVMQQETGELASRIEAARGLGRDQIEAFYAPELARLGEPSRTALVIALEALLDFTVWGRMRERHELGPAEARMAWRESIASILPTVEGRPSVGTLHRCLGALQGTASEAGIC